MMRWRVLVYCYLQNGLMHMGQIDLKEAASMCKCHVRVGPNINARSRRLCLGCAAQTPKLTGKSSENVTSPNSTIRSPFVNTFHATQSMRKSSMHLLRIVAYGLVRKASGVGYMCIEFTTHKSRWQKRKNMTSTTPEPWRSARRRGRQPS